MCVCTYVQEYVHVCVNTCSVLLVRGSVIPYLLHRSRHSRMLTTLASLCLRAFQSSTSGLRLYAQDGGCPNSLWYQAAGIHTWKALMKMMQIGLSLWLSSYCQAVSEPGRATFNFSQSAKDIRILNKVVELDLYVGMQDWIKMTPLRKEPRTKSGDSLSQKSRLGSIR